MGSRPPSVRAVRLLSGCRQARSKECLVPYPAFQDSTPRPVGR